MRTERPRVVMVVRLFHPWVGGTERQAHKLSASLIGMGLDVRVVTGWWFRGTPKSEVIDGVPVIRNQTLWEFFGIKGLRKFGGYLYILTLIWWLWRKRSTYDVVHVHGLNYHTFAAVMARRLTGKKVVVKLANSGPASDILRMRRGQKLALSGWMLPTALTCDRFVALNQAVVSELLAAGVPEEKIVEIPNGVEIPPAGPTRANLHDPVRVTYLGRLHTQKGLDVLLEAVKSHTSRPGSRNVELRLIGDGPDRHRLETLASDLGVDHVVSFPGIRDDVQAALMESDIFVLPSKAEGLSNALLEAMAAGLPVIASDVPGNADVITHGLDGLLVPPGDPEEIASSLNQLLEDDELRVRMGEQGRQTVEDHFDITTTAERYVSLYGKMIVPGNHPSDDLRPERSKS